MILAFLLLLLVVLLVVCGIGGAMFWLVKSRYKGKAAPDTPSIDAVRTSTSLFGDCARCGEHRLLINDYDRMCASCYSALRTKALS
jgi:hypothetical protein